MCRNLADKNGTVQTVIATIDYITYNNNKIIVKLVHLDINGITVSHVWVYSSELKCNFKFSKKLIGSKISFTATIDTYYKINKYNEKVMNYCLIDIEGIKSI